LSALSVRYGACDGMGAATKLRFFDITLSA